MNAGYQTSSTVNDSPFSRSLSNLTIQLIWFSHFLWRTVTSVLETKAVSLLSACVKYGVEGHQNVCSKGLDRVWRVKWKSFKDLCGILPWPGGGHWCVSDVAIADLVWKYRQRGRYVQLDQCRWWINSTTVDEFTEFCSCVKEPLIEPDEFGCFINNVN